ncbi:MAG: 2-succinyl-5-enolpyruvyl-6-hydroxy-3-cyclohexene-1-carboxylic-acid synthase [Bdellovibrionales bacterium]
MNNLQLAQAVLNACHIYGVREIVVCAGARNAPFVKILSKDSPFRIYSFFEERSAGFFALGRMRSTERPVAVITTSGTATAELLPAVIEAEYQSLPFVALTADRPRRYRGTGAPQTIVQPGIYSQYVEWSWDVEEEWIGRIEASRRRPIHLNVCFDEPLLAGTPASWVLLNDEDARIPSSGPEDFGAVPTPHFRKPLVIVGGLTSAEARLVAPVLKSWRRPLYLEGISQLRGRPELHAWELEGGEKSLQQIEADGVIRIGGVPALKFWRDLENQALPVLHFSSQSFSGLPRARDVLTLNALSTLGAQENGSFFEPWAEAEREADRARARELNRLLAKYPLSEPGWVHWLSQQISPSARLFLGNSLPVREWDLAAARTPSPEVFANRGVNGIDGIISTFLGVAEDKVANWCLCGDLSTLYDLSGPWAHQQRPVGDVNLVVINNGGGKIFRRIFNDPLFENGHCLQFEAWARMWNWDYEHVTEPRPLIAQEGRGARLIEITPNEDHTATFWEEWERI